MEVDPKGDGFRSACVTIFNWDGPAAEMYFDEECIRYAIWQVEKCPKTDKLHLQCYLEAKRAMRFKAWKRVCGFSSHIEERRKPREACIKYCSKEETRVEGPYEQGERELNKGGRPQTKADAIRVILQRIAEIGERAFMAEDPFSYALHKKEIKAVQSVQRTVAAFARFEEKFAQVQWRDWQANVLKLVEKQLADKDDRKIIWVWEEPGNIGKSFLGEYLKYKYDAALCAGKAADVRYSYDGQRVCVVDIPRSQMEYMAQLYTVSEELKNGRFLNGKYESCEKLFEPPVVLFFANARPDYDKWSRDRIVEIDLNFIERG